MRSVRKKNKKLIWPNGPRTFFFFFSNKFNWKNVEFPWKDERAKKKELRQNDQLPVSLPDTEIRVF